MNTKIKIACFFAHPDDESFGPGGTIAKYAAAGHQVHISTLTHGEAGSLGISKEMSRTDLAKKRIEELRCAVRRLKATSLKIHHLPDKQLSQLPEQIIVDILQSDIVNLMPDIIITFHENAISGHPDHKVVTNCTRKVVESLRLNTTLLYYGLALSQTTKITNRKLFAIQQDKITHQVDVSKFIDTKIKAIKCHRTQEELWQQIQKVHGKYEDFAKWEYFSQVWPKTSDKGIKAGII